MGAVTKSVAALKKSIQGNAYHSSVLRSQAMMLGGTRVTLELEHEPDFAAMSLNIKIESKTQVPPESGAIIEGLMPEDLAPMVVAFNGLLEAAVAAGVISPVSEPRLLPTARA